MFYINLMVTTNQKPVIDTHTHKKIIKKKSKNNTNKTYQATRKRAKQEEQRTMKTTIKQVIKW